MNESAKFRKLIEDFEPILMKEPLAELLGAFENDSNVLEYSLAEVIKMAGHCCPTITGAYLACKKALKELYNNEIPVRGDIKIKIYGKCDEGVYGVISQVFSFITGAVASNGFDGLGYSFRRKNLMTFSNETDNQEMTFSFERTDSEDKVLIEFIPQFIPFDDSEEMSNLMQKLLGGSTNKGEKNKFQDLWMRKIKNILNEIDINNWLKISNLNK